jgi:hypothetical protein
MAGGKASYYKDIELNQRGPVHISKQKTAPVKKEWQQ